MRSVRGRVLRRERSTLAIPGPRTTLRPALPNFACLGLRIQPCGKRRRPSPTDREFGLRRGIGNQIRAAGVEARNLWRAALQRNIGAVIDRKGVPEEKLAIRIQLPSAKYGALADAGEQSKCGVDVIS